MMRFLVALSIGVSLAQPALAADGSLRRFAIVAGASLGGSGRTPLRYATTDARDVSRVLRRLGGVALDDLLLLEEPDADRIRSAVSSVAVEAERSRQAGRRVELFVYYSGHSDEDGLLLGASRLPYAELRRELDRVPADVRVAILDSCASGAFTRAKGGVRRPPFLVDESNRVQGHAFLTSSAANETAQESDRLRASFFTHALLTGLRGAADASGDGVVTLNEAYQFAFRETLAGTEATQGGPQHATYDIGLVGSGDIVMTDLRRADALLVLPEMLDGRVFVRNSAGQLVAELRKTRGMRVELALEEGRYDVRLMQDRSVAAASFDLVSGRKAVVDEGRLGPAPLESTVSRGAGEDMREPPEPHDGKLRAAYWTAVRAGPTVTQAGSTRVGAHVELAAGVWFYDFVGAEVATGYYRISGTTQGRLPADGIQHDGVGYYAVTTDVEDVVSSFPTTFTIKLGIPADPVRPYLLGGAGLYFTHVDRRPARDYVWLAPGAEHLHDDAAYVGFHAGIGATLRLTRRMSAMFEARYALETAEVLQEKLDLRSVRAGVGLAF